MRNFQSTIARRSADKKRGLHTGLKPMPVPSELSKAVEVTEQYKGADQVEGAVHSWEAMRDGLAKVEANSEITQQAITCLKSMWRTEPNCPNM